MTVNKKVFKTHNEWLEQRKNKFYISSSNIATILGINPHMTPLELWNNWRQDIDVEHNSSMSRGQCLEDGIANWFEEETGHKVIKRSAEIAQYSNDKYPSNVVASPDRFLFAKGKKTRSILEIKDTNIIVDMKDISTIPSVWFVQIQHQMGIIEMEDAVIAINDGNKTLQSRFFSFDYEYFKKNVDYAIEWVQKHIIEGVAPEPINGDDVIQLYPDQEYRTDETTTDIFNMVERLKIKKEAKKRIDKDITELEDYIKSSFTDNNAISRNGNIIATWKETNKKVFSTNQFAIDNPEQHAKYMGVTSYRTLRLK